MRIRLFGILILFGFFSAKAQTWNPVGTGISGTSVNTTWSLFGYDSVLYAGGWFNNAGGTNVNDMAQWNGSNWDTVGSGTSGYINAMLHYNGLIYAGGFFDTIAGTAAKNIATWNGSSWMPVGKGLKGIDYGVYAMAIYNGHLYAGGSFDSTNGNYVYGLAQWDGTNWLKVGSGIYAADPEDGIFALAVYNGALYAAGEFDSAGGTPVISAIAKWNGTKWSAVGGYTNEPIFALAVYKGKLYAGGLFDTIGGIIAGKVAMWNDTVWSALSPGPGITGESNAASVNSLSVFNGGLYIGGHFDSADGSPANSIVKWDGTSWTALGSGINKGGSVSAMTVYDSALYVGGGFDSAGGVYAKNIAIWTAPSAINEHTADNKISVYPNPAGSYIIVNTTAYNPNASYTIYNIYGQEIITGTLHTAISTLTVSNLAGGLYMLVLQANGKQYTSKFIKE